MSKCASFSVSGLKVEKLIKKQTYTKTEAFKLYSRLFWIFLPNIIKIDPYNLSYTVSKFVRFFWDTVYYRYQGMKTKCSFPGHESHQVGFLYQREGVLQKPANYDTDEEPHFCSIIKCYSQLVFRLCNMHQMELERLIFGNVQYWVRKFGSFSEKAFCVNPSIYLNDASSCVVCFKGCSIIRKSTISCYHHRPSQTTRLTQTRHLRAFTLLCGDVCRWPVPSWVTFSARPRTRRLKLHTWIVAWALAVPRKKGNLCNDSWRKASISRYDNGTYTRAH